MREKIRSITRAIVLIGCLSLPAGAQRAFSVAVFPDTQLYARDHPETYEAMCRWIADNRDAYNIVFVSHVGDIVQDDRENQWQNARRAHDLLSEAGIAYGTAIGNHDGEDMYRHELTGKNFLRFFGPDSLYDLGNPDAGTFAEQAWWGGQSETGLSSYQTLDPGLTGGVPMLFLHLEVGMRAEEVEWARDVIEAHPDRAVVISTHRYLYDWRTLRGRYTQYIHTQFDPMYIAQDYDATQLFDRVIAQHPNVMMVWCGHNDGELRRTEPNRAGVPVHEMLHDYSGFSPGGGGGWFRIYTFDPALGQIRANTYSPTAHRFRDQADQIDGLLRALHAFAHEAESRAGINLSSLDPAIKQMIVRAFERTGAMSRFIQTMKTGKGEFAWLLGMLDGMEGERADRVRTHIRDFPWEDLTPGLVRLLDREGGPVVEAFLARDRRALDELFGANGNARLIEAFLSDGDRTPSFTLEIDFSSYLPSE